MAQALEGEFGQPGLVFDGGVEDGGEGQGDLQVCLPSSGLVRLLKRRDVVGRIDVDGARRRSVGQRGGCASDDHQLGVLGAVPVDGLEEDFQILPGEASHRRSTNLSKWLRRVSMEVFRIKLHFFASKGVFIFASAMNRLPTGVVQKTSGFRTRPSRKRRAKSETVGSSISVPVID